MCVCVCVCDTYAPSWVHLLYNKQHLKWVGWSGVGGSDDDSRSGDDDGDDGGDGGNDEW